MPVPNPTVPTGLTAGSQAKLYIQASGTGTAFVAGDQVPTSSELTFTPAGSVQSIPLFGTEFDRAVKTGISGTLNVTTLAPASDAVVTILLNAGMAVGPDAQVKYLVLNPDGSGFSGVAVVAAPVPQYEARGVFGYAFELTTDGTIAFEETVGAI